MHSFGHAPGTSGGLDAVFAGLADPTHRAIIERLADGEASVAELAEPFAMSQPAVSRQRRLAWDGRHQSRRQVATGIYFVRAAGADRALASGQRLLILRGGAAHRQHAAPPTPLRRTQTPIHPAITAARSSAAATSGRFVLIQAPLPSSNPAGCASRGQSWAWNAK